MKLILLSDLHQVGRRGDVVTSKPGYARNYLIPKGFAVQATAANEKWFEHQRKNVEARNRDGSVTASDIHEALEAKGFTIDRRQIDLHGGIKVLGEHEVRILLHGEVTAVVDLTVVAEK